MVFWGWGKELAALGVHFPMALNFRAAPLGEAHPCSAWLGVIQRPSLIC